VCGLNFYVLNVGKTYNWEILFWEKEYIIYVGCWLGPHDRT